MNKIINLAPILTKYPTNIYGLDFYPSLEPHFDSDRDACISGDLKNLFNPSLCSINYKQIDGESSVTQRVYDKVIEIIKSFSRDIFILEIGVRREEESRSITDAILKNKTKGSNYLGIDIQDRLKLISLQDRILILKTDSRNQDYIRERVDCLRRVFPKNSEDYRFSPKIDILVIDGDHSINCTINDWKYADLLSEDGVVLLHDSSGHPGCLCLLEAINKNIFSIDNSISDDPKDFGLAIIKKIKWKL